MKNPHRKSAEQTFLQVKLRKYSAIIHFKGKNKPISEHIQSTKKRNKQLNRLNKVSFEIMSTEIEDMFKHL